MNSLTVYSVYSTIVCSDNKVMVTDAAVPNLVVCLGVNVH
jgi:hypothetical protein